MKKIYESIFITNIPSFYKLNLYNRIQKHQDILVIFTGDVIQERTKDFFKGKCDFDSFNLRGFSTLKKIKTIAAIILNTYYKELVIGGWDSIVLWTAAILGNKLKNSIVIESSAIESKTTGIKGLIKRLFFIRITKAYASGRSQAILAEKLGLNVSNIVVTKGVGIFNYIIQPKPKYKDKIMNFLYVGRLAEEKNLKFLIAVFNSLPQFKLNIVGYGYQEQELKQIAGSNINFLGSVDNDKLQYVYQKNDVFILPSKVEPWGLVVEEALNNGLPIILSNCVGCADEILKYGINGYSFIFDNKDSLKHVIDQISKPKIYNKMAEEISRMDFEKIEDEQVKCYLHG